MTIEARVERLKHELVTLHGEGKLVFVSVVCNRCGRVVKADSLLKLLPLIEGWKLGEYGEEADFCPRCQ